MTACTTSGDPAAFRRSTTATVNLFFLFFQPEKCSWASLDLHQAPQTSLSIREDRTMLAEVIAILSLAGYSHGAWACTPKVDWWWYGLAAHYLLWFHLCGANILLWRWVPPKKRVCTEHVKYLLIQLMQAMSLQISLIDCRPQFSCQTQIYILTFPSVSLFLF